MRAAVFSCLGLGDGLISLVLSNNLAKHGWEVETFHPSFLSFQDWFPHLPLAVFPSQEKMDEVLSRFDRFFLFYEKSEWMFRVLRYCQEKHPDKLSVLNPIPTFRCDYPYWEVGKFNGRLPFVQNLVNYCRDSLHIAGATSSNGITLPPYVLPRRFPKRVVIHPTSSRKSRNWLWTRYSVLAERLEEEGFEPWFVMSDADKACLPSCRSPNTKTLSELAHFVAESGGMIGNDSGVGHLASCLGLPVVTLYRDERTAHFWRPGWSPTVPLTPWHGIPNIKFLRLRDKYWQYCITVGRVQDAFLELYQNTVPILPR